MGILGGKLFTFNDLRGIEGEGLGAKENKKEKTRTCFASCQ